MIFLTFIEEWCSNGSIIEGTLINAAFELKGKIPGSSVTKASYFTRGSHQDDVIRIQGTPTSINKYSDHEVWNYGFSSVDISLRDRKVTEWSNISGNFRVQ